MEVRAKVIACCIGCQLKLTGSMCFCLEGFALSLSKCAPAELNEMCQEVGVVELLPDSRCSFDPGGGEPLESDD